MEKQIGRPSDYNLEIAKEICDRVAMGDNLERIAGTEGFPSKQTIYNWLRREKAFLDEYAGARAIRSYARSDRIDQRAAEVYAGTLAPDAARVIIDTEKWQAGRENAKIFGDRIQTDSNININVQQIERSIVDVTPKPYEITDSNG